MPKSSLPVKTIEYSEKFSHHYTPHTNLFFSFYFIMTGLHALHVFVGIGLMFWMLSGVSKNPVKWDPCAVENARAAQLGRGLIVQVQP